MISFYLGSVTKEVCVFYAGVLKTMLETPNSRLILKSEEECNEYFLLFLQTSDSDLIKG